MPLPQQEVFTYDDMNRLDYIKYYVNDVHQNYNKSIEYDDQGYGNITHMTDIGDYHYDADPHAVSDIYYTDFPHKSQNITYSTFNKVSTISSLDDNDNNINLSLYYGIDDQRRKETFTNSGNSSKNYTKYYFGDYEEKVYSSVTKKFYYISSPTGLCAIKVDSSSNSKIWHVNTDHLGSPTLLFDSDNYSIRKYYSFSAWGMQRNPSNWTALSNTDLIADRGFTGHEHLSEFDLINMNGRVYDPVIAKFLSPDPYVQMPYARSGFNRYSYVLNNPLVYTDPSGENPLLVIAFLFFTDPGYELQKYVSPVAVRGKFRFGTHEKYVGYDISWGMPKLIPYASRKSYGQTYYWKHISSDYTGWETRRGWEKTYGWLFHEGETEYQAGKFSQTVGFYKVGVPEVFGVGFYNDVLGDGGDRYETAKVDAYAFPMKVQLRLYTGDPGLKRSERQAIEIEDPIGDNGGAGTYIKNPNNPYAPDPDEYRAGIFNVQFGPVAFGWDAESTRYFWQNILIHNLTDDPYFRYIKEHKRRFYFHFGW